jgi:hypothetical protein
VFAKEVEKLKEANFKPVSFIVVYVVFFFFRRSHDTVDDFVERTN